MTGSRRTRAGAWRLGAIGGGPLGVLLAVALAATAGGGGAAATGAAPDDGPIALLGSTFDASGCATAPQRVGHGTVAMCDDFSAVLVGGTVRVVTLSGESGVVAAYPGTLPGAVSWYEPLEDVVDALGRPQRITDIYGPPTLVYMYRDREYGSIEYQFDEHDELVRINVSVTR